MSNATQPLERGGLLVETAAGAVQIGAPPETIKDTMRMASGVPNIFVLPTRLFDFDRGLNLAELEFPIYFNFFVLKRKIHVVGLPEQQHHVEGLIGETLFPPVPQNLAAEFPRRDKDPALPDMDKELGFFQRHPQEVERKFVMDDIVQFHPFPADIEGTRIELDEATDEVVVSENGTELDRRPRDLRLPPAPKAPPSRNPFHPPMFGATALGTGSGFDPTSATSGFVFWVNRRGLMVDPPVDVYDHLHQERISPRLIQDVILTHVHADHDAGILQKILEEGIIRLYTTPSILEAFLRKAVRLTGLSENELRGMIDYIPVKIGAPQDILGAQVRFWYNVHSIPTIGFEMVYQDKRLVYSSDALNVPDNLQLMSSAGILPDGRLRDLLNFPWDADLVIHEAGIPPLHTPPEALAKLSDDIKDHLYLVHTVEDKVKTFPGLRMMEYGIENTLTLPVADSAEAEKERILSLFAAMDLFQMLPEDRAEQALKKTRRVRLQPGELMIRKGDPGKEVFFILEGAVTIIRDGGEYKTYGPGDYVGDMALVREAPRFADVVAKSEVDCLALSKDDFLALMKGTMLRQYLQHLADIREEDSWPLLVDSPVTGSLTTAQLTQLQGLLTHHRFGDGEDLPGPEQAGPFGHLVITGSVQVGQNGDALKAGHVAGRMVTVEDPEGLCPWPAKAAGPVETYAFSGPAFQDFLDRNPGARLRLTHHFPIKEQLGG